MLRMKLTVPMGQPVKLLMICAVPLRPPATRSLGMKNRSMLTASSAAPRNMSV